MTIPSTPKGQLTVYCAGGAGFNIGRLLEADINNKNPLFATLNLVFIDTSQSNLTSDIKSEKVYHIQDLDGSGKRRRENSKEIQDHLRMILQKFPAGDAAIVISSAAGGSGSVIAPLLVRDLLADGKTVIALTIASSASKVEIENTLNTLQSYEAIAKKTQKPVVLGYFANTKERPRKTVNATVALVMSQLAMLFSRQNFELDSKDLANWLTFDQTSFGPQLASLTIMHQEELAAFKDTSSVISVASLAMDHQEHAFPMTPEYHAQGYLPGTVDKTVMDNVPLHFVISGGQFEGVAKQLSGALTAFDQQRDARIKRPSLLDADDVDDSGLVL